MIAMGSDLCFHCNRIGNTDRDLVYLGVCEDEASTKNEAGGHGANDPGVSTCIHQPSFATSITNGVSTIS
jgi:hypothetical protein